LPFPLRFVRWKKKWAPNSSTARAVAWPSRLPANIFSSMWKKRWKPERTCYQRSKRWMRFHAAKLWWLLMKARVCTYCPKSLRRSEEHPSELQSLTNLVCRLLLEKKPCRLAGTQSDVEAQKSDRVFGCRRPRFLPTRLRIAPQHFFLIQRAPPKLTIFPPDGHLRI